MLLDLPPELVQLILKNCDPRTYLHLASTCRGLYAMAMGNSQFLRHQLCGMPGWKNDVDDLDAEQLVLKLRASACRELYGTENFTNRQLIDFDGKRLNTRACTLEASEMKHNALLSFHGDESVYFVWLRAGHVHLQRKLESPAKKYGTIEVLLTSFNEHGAFVLHRFQPFVDTQLDPSHPFVKQAMKTYPQGPIFLAYYPFSGNLDHVQLCNFPDEQDYDPVALASFTHEKFAISWQHRQRDEDHHVILYFNAGPAVEDDEVSDMTDEDSQMADGVDNEVQAAATTTTNANEPEVHEQDQIAGFDGLKQMMSNTNRVSYFSCSLTEMNQEDHSDNRLIGRGPSTKLTFNDRGGQMLHYFRGQTLFGSFQKLDQLPERETPSLHSNHCVVEYSPSLMLQFAIGIPFYLTHRTGAQSNRPNTCHWQYLAVGIATHRVEHWTVACLMKAQSNPQAMRCNHQFNLDRGRRFDNWTCVAQLGGFREADTTQGSLLAASPRGTRLALASWKTVTVWSLNPQVLLDRIPGFYPDSWENSAGLTELRPAVIQLDAVCSQLAFTSNENELVAITDRGLMFLDIQPTGQGIEIVARGNIFFNDSKAA